MSAQAMPHGVVPVLETPFHEDASIDEESFDRILSHVLSTGVSGVMFPGFASEFGKLRDDERGHLQRRFVTTIAQIPGAKSIVSIPDHATEIAVAAVRSAVGDGADIINVLPPFWLSPSRSAVLEHLHEVTEAAGPTPVVIQYAPAQTGSALTADDIRGLATDHPNLVGVKVESTPPGPMVEQLANGVPRLESLVGYAGLFLPDSLRRGSVGVQPGCSFAEIYVELWARHIAGDSVGFRDLHTRLLPYLLTWMQHVELIVQVEKTISVRRGLISTDRCRRPGWTLDAVDLQDIDNFLEEFNELLPAHGTSRG